MTRNRWLVIAGLTLHALGCPKSTPTPPPAVTVTPAAVTTLVGRTQQFSASVSNSSSQAVTWSASGGSIDQNGLFTAPATPGTVTVTATSQADTTKSGTATVTVSEIAVSVSPASSAVPTAATEQFTATVTGWSDTSVTWTASAGSIDPAGLFTAPGTVGTVTVTATSKVDPAKSASATVSIFEFRVSPSTATVAKGGTQQFVATIVGLADTSVTWSASAGSIDQNGLYTAPGTTGLVTVTATSKAAPSRSATASVTVIEAGVTVTPSSASLLRRGKQQFVATVVGLADRTVNWRASCTGACITDRGLFTAPDLPGTVTVTATSNADPTKSASATVAVGDVAIGVSPTNPTVLTGSTRQFIATVTNLADTSVGWTTSGGTIDGGGLLTAPSTPGNLLVTATSKADARYSGVAPVYVHYPWRPQVRATTQGLRAIWGAAGDAFAVGAGGTILRLSGTTWSKMDSGRPEDLNGVWGSSSTDVFAVGAGGVILHFDGTRWAPQVNPDPTKRLSAVWGSSPTNVFAVGESGTLLRYDGTAWSKQALATSNQLVGVWGSSATDVYVVGAGGTILHFNGTVWSAQDSPSPADLRGVWGSSAGDVFAVGANGVVLHSNGLTWTSQPTGEGVLLYSVWGTSGSDVFAIGAGGAVLHFDGTAWMRQVTLGMPSGTLYGVWGRAADDVLAVGDGGTIGHYGPWTAPTQTSVTLSPASVSMGTGARQQFVATVADPVDRSVTWATTEGQIDTNGAFTAPAEAGTVVVTATSRANPTKSAAAIVTVGPAAVALSPPTTALQTNATLPLTATVTGLADTSVDWTATCGSITPGAPPTASYLAPAASGTCLVTATSKADTRYSGTAVVDVQHPWRPMSSGAVADLRGVWGTSGSDVFAVGTAGTILHFNGTAWTSQGAGVTTQPLAGVWGSANNDVFAVGAAGTILHFDGTNWTVQGAGVTTQPLAGVWGSAYNDVFAVGAAGTILHFDGSAWTKQESGTTQVLSGVWGNSGSDVFAVGAFGTILRFNGSAWSPLVSGTGQSLSGVWGGRGTVLAAGGSGTIRRFDGGAWIEHATPTTQALLGIWGPTAGAATAPPPDVFAVGSGGTVLHSDGTRWAAQKTGTNVALHGVWGTTEAYVFAVGDGGTILRYQPVSGAPPAAPGNLVATAQSWNTIGLTWVDGSTNETGFRIERAAAQAGPWAEVGTAAANATSYDDGGLTGSTAYYYRVRATNDAGESDYSNVATATTSAPPICTAAATRCVAGDPGLIDVCNPDGTAWARQGCADFQLCAAGACHAVCEITATPANPTVCIVPVRDDVNDVVWVMSSDPLLAMPTYVRFSASPALPRQPAQDTWPSAWRIAMQGYVGVQFTLNQFGGGTRHPRLWVRGKLADASPGLLFDVNLYAAGTNFAYCEFSFPATWTTDNCNALDPFAGQFNYAGQFNEMRVVVPLQLGNTNRLDVNYIKLEIQP